MLDLLEKSLVITCSAVRLEILGAAKKSERWQLDSDFSSIPYLNIDSKVWNKAIHVSRDLRDRGLSIPWNDVLIATTALEYAVPIYAVDKHFEEMSKVVKPKLH